MSFPYQSLSMPSRTSWVLLRITALSFFICITQHQLTFSWNCNLHWLQKGQNPPLRPWMDQKTSASSFCPSCWPMCQLYNREIRLEVGIPKRTPRSNLNASWCFRFLPNSLLYFIYAALSISPIVILTTFTLCNRRFFIITDVASRSTWGAGLASILSISGMMDFEGEKRWMERYWPSCALRFIGLFDQLSMYV